MPNKLSARLTKLLHHNPSLIQRQTRVVAAGDLGPQRLQAEAFQPGDDFSQLIRI
jgi:hypothetical protein